jgi:hypothetical protein
MLLFERQADASWMPTTVILATPKRLQGKCLPGSPPRDERLTSILQNALPPRLNDFTEERGTYEDWITWGVYNLANGMTTWATEIKPEGTVDTLPAQGSPTRAATSTGCTRANPASGTLLTSGTAAPRATGARRCGASASQSRRSSHPICAG